MKAKTNRIKRSKDELVFDIFNYIVLILVLLIILYPLYFIIIASISDVGAVMRGQVFLYPKGFTLDAYTNVLRNASVWIGYRNTIVYTILYTLLALFLTVPAAYGLSKQGLPGKRVINWFFIITMYFSGGLVPTYLLIKDMDLINKPAVMVVVGAFGVMNMIITRNYFETSIPSELYEAAKIDGCNEFKVFFRIALPLAKPILAVMALYYGVTQWNSYFNALIYLSNEKLYPLQLILRNILMLNQLLAMDPATLGGTGAADALLKQAYMAEQMKYSLVFIASFPLLVAYPFVQKHFAKGVMLGSVKG